MSRSRMNPVLTARVCDPEPRSQLGLRMPRRLHRAVKLAALQRDVRLQDYVAEACREKLDRHGAERDELRAYLNVARRPRSN